MNKELYHMNGGSKIPGKHAYMFANLSALYGNATGLVGDCSKLYGDCTKLYGDASGLSGNCTQLYGDCTGVFGDLDFIKIDRLNPYINVAVSSLTEDVEV
jgi:hypothetical protein